MEYLIGLAIGAVVGSGLTLLYHHSILSVGRAVDKGKVHILLPSRDNPRIFEAAIAIATGEKELENMNKAKEAGPKLSVIKGGDK